MQLYGVRLTNLLKQLKANACYGALGNKGFHYYDYRIAEAITITGQYSDRHLANALNDKFNQILKTKDVDYVIYGDTDSLYLNCNPLVEAFMSADAPRDKIVAFLDKFGKNVCQPIIDASIDYIFEHMNAHVKVMASKREAIASKMLFRARKNYAMYVHNSEGVSYNPPKLKVLGIEIVRSSTPKWCRKKLKELLNMMFEVEEDVFRSKFSQFEKEYMLLSPEEIASPRGVSDLTKYFNGTKFTAGVTIPMHVRAAALYNLHTKELKHYAPITNGDKIKFLPLKMPNKIKENVIGFPTNEKLPLEIGIHKYIDYDKQFFKTFETPMRSLTDVAGWKIREESSLEAFF